MTRITQYNREDVAISLERAILAPHRCEYAVSYFLIDKDKQLMTELDAAQRDSLALPKSVKTTRAAARVLAQFADAQRRTPIVVAAAGESQALDFYRAMQAIADKSRKNRQAV